MPGPIPRPVNGMRGYQTRWSQKAFAGIFVAVAGSMAWFYFGIQRPRHNKFAHFYATADPYKMLEKICEKNAFESCPQNLAKKKGI